LGSGDLYTEREVQEAAVRRKFPTPKARLVEGKSAEVATGLDPERLTRLQMAFGMTKEDLDVLIRPMAETGKPSVGSMGDDTSPAALLDTLPRRLEDHFALRFAQETSPPIDPVRDAWAFDTAVSLGDRRGPWKEGTGPVYRFDSPVLSEGQRAWLMGQPGVQTLWALSPESAPPEAELQRLVNLGLATDACVLIVSDRYPDSGHIGVQPTRLISRLHRSLVAAGRRHRVSILADVAVWDIHHCALLTTLGADAVCPWLGLASAEGSPKYLAALRSGLTEAMSMMGVTPATAYCGAGLVESIGLDPAWVEAEFGVPHHLGGIHPEHVTGEWRAFHSAAFEAEGPSLVDAGEFRHSKDGRRHHNNAEIVRSLHLASGYTQKLHAAEPGSRAAYYDFSRLVSERPPMNVLDTLHVREGTPISLEQVEPVEAIAWRFMAPGMSEGAISEPAHRSVARGLNVLSRYCRLKAARSGVTLEGIGPIANSGEGGFDKSRVNTRDFNRSVQYAGGRFTITPATAANAAEAEVKFAQGAKPGKGGQLPGKKVSAEVARRRGCEPGFELVSPPINHNLYSIEDVKLMLESWRHLNPDVNCALKFVATYGVEMVALGGVNAGANRLHISDGCGGTGAAKRVDQKHAGVPVAAVLATVQNRFVEENVRHLVELSVDGGVQNGEQALKLMLLGADRVGFGTSLLISIGCSMLRKCHLSGPDPSDPTGKRRLGCTPGIATQDPQWIARFTGNWKHVARMLLFVAEEIRERMAAAGIERLGEVIGRRDLLVRRSDLTGKAALLDLSSILRAAPRRVQERDFRRQTKTHLPPLRREERAAAMRACLGYSEALEEQLTNEDRCVGVGAAGILARKFMDAGLPASTLRFRHSGVAGQFYAAYCLDGMAYDMTGVVADSCFTAAYGGELVVRDPDGHEGKALVGNAFGYGCRGGRAFIAGRAGNRFGICMRKNAEGGGATVVVEGIEACGFQYMTGGTGLVLGSVGPNFGSGMTGGVIYAYDLDPKALNTDYVQALPLEEFDARKVCGLLETHVVKTGSSLGLRLLTPFDPARFVKVVTGLMPESVE
ncbi:MAG TPA: glutamate synthase-related protein, partial [Fimbriimonadaceae bacterium]|nr:glutamate synthase-related protein [Fimbriimonadaceae bacterium]